MGTYMKSQYLGIGTMSTDRFHYIRSNVEKQYLMYATGHIYPIKFFPHQAAFSCYKQYGTSSRIYPNDFKTISQYKQK